MSDMSTTRRMLDAQPRSAVDVPPFSGYATGSSVRVVGVVSKAELGQRYHLPLALHGCCLAGGIEDDLRWEAVTANQENIVSVRSWRGHSHLFPLVLTVKIPPSGCAARRTTRPK